MSDKNEPPPRGFLLRNEGGPPFGSVVQIDGVDVARGVAAIRYEHRAGDVPTLELDLAAIGLTEIRGKARVRVLVSGVEFTWDDVDLLRLTFPEGDWRGRSYVALADRLANILPPRGPSS